MWRKKSSRGDPKHSDTDVPHESKLDTTTWKQNIQELLPDKELEERVLSDRSEYLASNLPADDVAPVMFAKGLLTPKEYEEFKTMKRGGRVTTTSMSEYLLECLRKRRAGFLKAFCSILQEVEPAKYLVDDILKAYSGASRKSGDTLSIRSMSDPDLRQKLQTTQILQCANCKKIKGINHHLEKQLAQLSRDYNRLIDAKIKVEAQLEILEDQLQQQLKEKQNLQQIIPHLQQATVLIDRVSSSTGDSGPQKTLHRISGLIREQGKHEVRSIGSHFYGASKWDSTQSIPSDTSSVAGSYPNLHTPDENRHHSTDSTLHAEQSRSSAKPATQGIDKIPAQETGENNHQVANTTGNSLAQTSLQNGQYNSSETTSYDQSPVPRHIRSGSSPAVHMKATAIKRTKSYSKGQGTSRSIIIGRSKSFNRSRTDSSTDPHFQELAEKLSARRQKLDADSATVPSQSQ